MPHLRFRICHRRPRRNDGAFLKYFAEYFHQCCSSTAQRDMPGFAEPSHYRNFNPCIISTRVVSRARHDDFSLLDVHSTTSIKHYFLTLEKCRYCGFKLLWPSASLIIWYGWIKSCRRGWYRRWILGFTGFSSRPRTGSSPPSRPATRPWTSRISVDYTRPHSVITSLIFHTQYFIAEISSAMLI